VTRGRRRQIVAGFVFGVLAVVGAIVVVAGGRDSGPALSASARRYPADSRALFVRQVRAADQAGELKDVDDTELVNRAANYCIELARTGSSLKAVFNLQLAKLTRPGDVYVTGAARRVLCADLPDSDSGR